MLVPAVGESGLLLSPLPQFLAVAVVLKVSLLCRLSMEAILLPLCVRGGVVLRVVGEAVAAAGQPDRLQFLLMVFRFLLMVLEMMLP